MIIITTITPKTKKSLQEILTNLTTVLSIKSQIKDLIQNSFDKIYQFSDISELSKICRKKSIEDLRFYSHIDETKQLNLSRYYSKKKYLNELNFVNSYQKEIDKFIKTKTYNKTKFEYINENINYFISNTNELIYICETLLNQSKINFAKLKSLLNSQKDCYNNILNNIKNFI